VRIKVRQRTNATVLAVEVLKRNWPALQVVDAVSLRRWLLGLDSFTLAASEGEPRGDGGQPGKPTRAAGWLTSLDKFRNWLIRGAA